MDNFYSREPAVRFERQFEVTVYEKLVFQLSVDAEALASAREGLARARKDLDDAAEQLAEAESVYEEAALLLETEGESQDKQHD